MAMAIRMQQATMHRKLVDIESNGAIEAKQLQLRVVFQLERHYQ